MKLSVMIPSVPGRSENFGKLAMELERQAQGRDVEILGLYDNRTRTVGEKRQALLDLARGTHVVCIDDDDWISEDYLASILEEPMDPYDAVVFQIQHTNLQNKQVTLCEYNPEWTNGYTTRDKSHWRGKPNHIHVVRAEIAKSIPWRTRPRGRQWNIDIDWAVAMCAKLQNIRYIPKVLYYYNFNPRTSETARNNRRNA
jgi:glycosyltransferase involved in cell wall biosynthesis